MPDISEKDFEAIIESLLLAGGTDDPEPSRTLRECVTVLDGAYVPGSYNKRAPEEYDKALCLIPKDVLNFILITQPKERDKLKKNAPNETDSHFLNLLSGNIKKYGTLHVLRNGIKSLPIWGGWRGRVLNSGEPRSARDFAKRPRRDRIKSAQGEAPVAKRKEIRESVWGWFPTIYFLRVKLLHAQTDRRTGEVTCA